MTTSIVRKLVLVGNADTGKTAIMNRYHDDTFTESYIATIGVDFQIHRIDISDENCLRLQIWDTAGQERFRTLTHTYYKNANTIVIVFDLTNRVSFDAVPSWIETAKSHTNQPIFLVGNKAEMSHARVVSREEAQAIAAQHGMPYYEVSAKTGENIDNLFKKINEDLLTSFMSEEQAETITQTEINLNHENSDVTENSTQAAENARDGSAAPEVPVVKVAMFGDALVGKSSIVNQVNGEEFGSTARASAKSADKIQTVTCKDSPVKIQMFDLAGSSEYRSVFLPAAVSVADVIIIVFDLTSLQSFDNLKDWQSSLRQFDTSCIKKKILVGNKCDLNSRAVDYVKAKNYAESNGFTYLEVSAKDHTNVEELKQLIAEVGLVNEPTGSPVGYHKSDLRKTSNVRDGKTDTNGNTDAPEPGNFGQRRVKVVLIGDSGVGKSNILLQYADNVFYEQHLPTIGVDFKIRPVVTDQGEVRLQIWDTAGQERFRTITSSYYRGADVIMIVFDLSYVDSFNNVKNWLEEVSRYVDDRTPLILVGNKADIVESRRVDNESAKRFAEWHNMSYFEVSAKDGSNVQELFRTAAALATHTVEKETENGASTTEAAENVTKNAPSTDENGRSQRTVSASSTERSNKGRQVQLNGQRHSAKASEKSSKKSNSSSSSRWIDTRKLHESLVKSESPETGHILRKCETLLEVERTFVRDLTEMIEDERAYAYRKREVLNAKWNDRIYEPMKQKLVERQRADGYRTAIQNKLTSYEDYLAFSSKRDSSFLCDFDALEYDPFKWQRAEGTQSKPVQMTGVDPCQLYLHNQREETRLINKYDRASTRFVKNHETGSFEFYRQLPQLQSSRRSLAVTSAPSSLGGKRSQRRPTKIASIAFGTHYLDQETKKSSTLNWSNMGHFDVDSLSKHNTSDANLLSRNKSHFELTWSSENDQSLIDREMSIPKRRAFPERQKHKTSAEFREAHFKLEPIIDRPPHHYDEYDDYIVHGEEPIPEHSPLVAAE